MFSPKQISFSASTRDFFNGAKNINITERPARLSLELILRDEGTHTDRALKGVVLAGRAPGAAMNPRRVFVRLQHRRFTAILVREASKATSDPRLKGWCDGLRRLIGNGNRQSLG